MTQDEEWRDLFARIQQAIDLTYASTSTNEQRAEALKFCESLKTRPDAPMIAHRMAHKDSRLSDPVRHFALSVLESSVAASGVAMAHAGSQGSHFPWENTMKPILVDLITNGTNDIAEEKLFIKEKIVRLFVEAAKRFWPHHWVDMDKLLRQLFFSSPKHQELVLGVYRTLSEDIYILEDDVATLRKRDLSTSMSAVFFSEDALPTIYGDTSSDPTSKRPKKGVDIEKIVRMIRSDEGNNGWLKILATSLMEHHQRWLTAIEGNMPEGPVFHLLALDTMRTVGACLAWVSTRALLNSEVLYVTSELLESPSPAAADALCQLVDRSMANEESFWASIMVPFVDGSPDMKRPAILDRIASSWEACGRSPGETISVKNLAGAADVATCLNEENYRLARTLSKSKLHSLSAVSEYYLDMDFDDETEAAAILMGLKQKLYDIIRWSVPLEPLGSFNWASQRILAIFTSNPRENTEIKFQMDMCVSIFDSTVKGVFDSPDYDPKKFELSFISFCESLLQIDSELPSGNATMAFLILPLKDTIASKTDILIKCLQKNLYDQFLSSVQPLMMDKTLPIMDRQKIYEFLITIIHYSTVPTWEQKQNVFGSIVRPILEKLSNHPLHQFDTAEGTRELLGISFSSSQRELLGLDHENLITRYVVQWLKSIPKVDLVPANEISAQYKAMLARRIDVEKSNDKPLFANELELFIDKTRSWIANMRENWYSAFPLVFQVTSSLGQSAQANLCLIVFSGTLNHFQTRDVALDQKLPTRRATYIFAGYFTPVFLLNSNETEDSLTEDKEIMAEMMLRQLTQSFGDLLGIIISLCFPNPETGKEAPVEEDPAVLKSAAERRNELIAFFIQNPTDHAQTSRSGRLWTEGNYKCNKPDIDRSTKVFEEDLKGKTIQKEQHALVRTLLTQVQGVPVSQLLKQDKGFSVPTADDTLSRPSRSKDLLDTSDETSILGVLE
ncbi:hypothetical protein HDU67_005479 [Dinochytrium kinnereticum]|nr:hypothetical protein HDU67_005479 [Dinochytrium kinnereticum]